MRARTDGDCDLVEELELKKTGIDILQALLEGQGQKVAVYERVLSVIHLDVIQLMCSIGLSDKPKKAEGDDDVGEEKEEESDEEVSDIQLTLRTESLVLLQMLCDFKPILRKELDVIRELDKKKVGSDGVAFVEVMWRGELQRRFFNIPTLCKDFTDSSKSNFVEHVDRTSTENKLLDLYRRSKVIYIELLHQKFLHEIN